MTRLLVSVRNAAEARTALEVGVDLLDLKEPNRGALGTVDTATVAEVVELVAGRVPVSMALGELVDYFQKDESLDPQVVIPDIPRGVGLVKVGLKDCWNRRHWTSHWKTIARNLPATVRIVVVVYADVSEASSPAIGNVLELTSAGNCGAVLVDTAIKDGRTLLDHWTPETLRRFVTDVRRRGLTTVVGGGLTLETIPLVAACGPDYVAVRGAACSGPRTGTLCARQLTAVKERITSLSFTT